MAKVREVLREGQSVVVEYRQNGIPYRVVVPSDAIENGEVEDEFLAIAPTHGTDFYGIALKVIQENYDPEQMAELVAEELSRRNIWDFNDLAGNRRMAREAVNSLFGNYFAKFYAAVAEDENERT